ncbi:GNAT family N-acetyltransferase [Ferrimonas balearica]|uniref:GNAT family N-acetyltransferase n=1 Tax=Ferrimonas balearica TaxID=44012 RepID=UPI001C5A1D74|nr:GNAT family N-acetyltransferase [Ferrimonas balearica]
MTPLIRGPRLSLYRFAPRDAAGFMAMNADPRVLQHTGDRPFADDADALRFIQHYDHYQRHGFGRWSLYTHKGEYAGFCGLRRAAGEVDLGYRLPWRLWGQGLATEAAQLALQLGFERFDLDSIVGRARCANPGSIRVLEKVGMGLEGAFTEEGHDWLQYRIRSHEWTGLPFLR